VAVVDRARELRVADDVPGGRADQEVRLAGDLALLAIEIDDGGEALCQQPFALRATFRAAR
jgi:hypothetical protein